MNIWAHRGCSYRFPENTLSSFAAACLLDITGIELDVQLSSDGVPVVIHDERVDRTTNGTGWVRDMTLEQLKSLSIEQNLESGAECERIPTLDEVLDLVEEPCKTRGLLVNIELKTSEIRYEGIEEKVLGMVRERGLEQSIVWSSFLPASVERIIQLDRHAETGVLDTAASDCLSTARRIGAKAIHPFVDAIDVEHLSSFWSGPVRAWNMGKPEPFFPSTEPIELLDLAAVRAAGVTDLFTNAPELYVGQAGDPDPLSGIVFAINRRVDPASGRLIEKKGCATNWEPIRLRAGSRLVWLDPSFEWQAFAYDDGFDPELVHTYCYHEEQNWTHFRPDLSTSGWSTGGMTVDDDIYLRLCVRRTDGEPLAKAPLASSLASVARVLEPRPIPRHIIDEARSVAKRVEDLRKPGDLVIQLIADPHYVTGGIWDDTVHGLHLVSRRIHPDYLVQLGDLTDGLAPAEVTERVSARLLGQLGEPGLPMLGCIGNHDTNYFRNNPELMDDARCARLYLGRKTPWYHVDDREHGVRLLFLHSFDPKPEDRNRRYGYLPAELAWVRLMLATTPSSWKVLVFSHVPPLGELHHWSDDIRCGERLVSMLERWHVRNGGRVLALVHGHNHADQVYTRRAFPIVGIGCAKLEDFPEHKPAGSVTWPREQGTQTQELWDVLVVHPTANTCDFVRFGAGEDRRVASHARA